MRPTINSLSQATSDRICGVPTLSEPTQKILSEKECMDYQKHHHQFLSWLYTLGKCPERAEGYAEGTVQVTHYHIDRFYRWLWNYEGHYTTEVTHEHANTYLMEYLSREDVSRTTTAKLRKALLREFRWRAHLNRGKEWKSVVSISEGTDESAPPDFLSKEERRLVREAVLRYADVKEQQPEFAGEEAGSWKYVSLVWTSLDAGLRPVEVTRATTGWVDSANALLRIPKAESAKAKANWNVPITERTANALSFWFEERAYYPKYAKYREETGQDVLWLTRSGNPYGAQALARLLRNICDEANIDYSNRKMTWYTIRHGLGNAMTSERDLKATQAQLRHKSSKTTMRYDHPSEGDRRDALDRMGSEDNYLNIAISTLTSDRRFMAVPGLLSMIF